ncbi:hypothetical protein AgCh_007657 [Apium graveolens]
MVILAAKLIYGVALEPLLFTPWVKSNGVMRCLKVRNFGSWIPVRTKSSNSKGGFRKRFAPKKPPKPEISRSLVTPVNDFHHISRHGSLESDVLSLESLDGGNIMVRSFEVDEELGDFDSPEDTELVTDFARGFKIISTGRFTDSNGRRGDYIRRTNLTCGSGNFSADLAS